MNLNKLFAYMIILTLFAGIAFAEDDSFVLNKDYANNLYLAANNIEINSNLYGDLFAVSDSVNIKMLVRDDVNLIVGVLNVEGNIGSDLRALSGSTKVEGTIFGEAMIAGSYVYFDEASAVGGIVHINADVVIIDGTLKDDLYVTANKVVINGVVEGNAVIKSPNLEMGPKSRILGDLSSSEDISDVSSHVEGAVIKIVGKESPDSFTSITFRKIGLFLTLFLIGCVLIFGSSKFTEKASKAVQTRFLLSLVTGLIFLVVAPFAVIFTAFTFVGLPIAILLGLAYVAAVILSFGMSSILVGKAGLKLFKEKKSLWIELLIGALALALISIIAPVFWILVVIIMMAAVGSAILVFIKKDKKK